MSAACHSPNTDKLEGNSVYLIVSYLGILLFLFQDSLSSVDGLLKKHDNFATSLEAQREKITALEQLTEELLAQDHYASEQIKARRQGVVDRMNRVLQTAESRRRKLTDSRNYQQFLANIYEVEIVFIFLIFCNIFV